MTALRAVVPATVAARTDTTETVRRFAAGAPFPVHLVHEPQRGTDAAADTGFRPAARLLVRTDADRLPARAEFARGTERACGRSLPCPDTSPNFAQRHLLPAVLRATALYGPPEDVALLNRAREHSERTARAEHMVVRTGLRRLPWCWDRRRRPTDEREVHVR
ncbi:hypothetical protein GCM10010218_40230 [Streptomyces mashuensis]|uniref:Uncharacterized protein n=1 Tax=Streptomyces mashuensis TaxID=33904 RepID=A0A919B604_9ACTN|nr:hypothetical protein [Streptomyces mashuensis]GHF54859.1 hypothetical protein GCM10010218_40230 [Streptomyces mashuensis]